MSEDYLELTYSPQRLPPSVYPQQLAGWLASHVLRKPGRLIDIGCGRGEYLKAFASLGYETVGIDRAESAKNFGAPHRVELLHVGQDPFPFDTGSFDYVFSKSLIEHLRQPDAMLNECMRILRPGGIILLMTPSWRHQWRVFYEDFTHVSPYGRNGLMDAMTLAGFENVTIRYFWQLPFLWKNPWFSLVVRFVGCLPLKYRPWDSAPWPESINKLIRFSKEAMLLGVGIKSGK